MESLVFPLLLVIGVLAFAASWGAGESLARNLNGYFNRREYEYALRKAESKGIGAEFLELFLEYAGTQEFKFQRPGLALRVLLKAERRAKFADENA
jgi:hypothetical protein